jgi:DNA-directed RNA polymerase subunit RPC12/RpoP
MKVKNLYSLFFHYKCPVCKLSVKDKENLKFQLDYINGNIKDNRIENLRYICLECLAKLNTVIPNRQNRIFVGNSHEYIAI